MARGGHLAAATSALLALVPMAASGCGSSAHRAASASSRRPGRSDSTAITAPAAPTPATSSTTTSTPPTSAAVTPASSVPRVPATTALAAQGAVPALVASHGPHASASPVTTTGNGTYLAVAYARVPASGPLGGVPTLVDVYRWGGSRWVLQPGSSSDGGVLDPTGGYTVSTASLTGGPLPDFVISGSAGAADTGLFVVASVRGSWEAVPVAHPSGGPVLIDGRVDGNDVQETVNDCNPDCVTGSGTTTTYTFSAGQGRFVAIATSGAAG